MFSFLEKGLTKENNSHMWQWFMAASLEGKLCYLLGTKNTRNFFDSACKMFLVEAWHVRRIASRPSSVSGHTFNGRFMQWLFSFNRAGVFYIVNNFS